MTKTISDIKPKVEGLAEAARVINNLTSIFVSMGGKKINIKYGECDRWGSLRDCTNPDCSIFNHSDHNSFRNLPEGFVEP